MSTISYESILVTGTNRGIGLQFIVQLLKRTLPTSTIIATTRSSAAGQLQELQQQHPDRLHILHYDATDYEALPSFVEQVQAIVGERGLQLLINNAGAANRGLTAGNSRPDNSSHPETMVKLFENNAVAPLALTQALLPLLKVSAAAGKRTVVANISSLGGSIADNNRGGGYSYRTSKVTKIKNSFCFLGFNANLTLFFHLFRRP